MFSFSQTGAVHSEFYVENDLTLGSTINANGRRLILADCDDFTKEYYKQKYGVCK